MRGCPRLPRPALSATEAIAYDFLAAGGKHLRPFITLAAYDAMTRRRTARWPTAPAAARPIPDAVQRVALAIEVFHKASLVHDDIEDDDPFRYGRPTLHRNYGMPLAINVGDYLIGLGYRLVAEQREALGPEVGGRHPGPVRPGPHEALRRPRGRAGLARRPDSGN